MKVLMKNKNNASVRGAWQPTLLACSLVWHRQSSPASVLAVWILLDSARPTFGSTRRRDLHFAYVSLHTYIGNATNIPFGQHSIYAPSLLYIPLTQTEEQTTCSETRRRTLPFATFYRGVWSLQRPL